MADETMSGRTEQARQAELIVPVGTQIVTRVPLKGTASVAARGAGEAGVLIAAPGDSQHAYRARFPDGAEVALRRSEFAILKQYQRGELADAGDAREAFERYAPFVMLRVTLGSRAYGLDSATSDVDRRGVYLPPADLHWSLYGVPEQIRHPDADEEYWEVQKFLTLALKANPTVLECLYTPLVEEASSVAHELLAMRTVFLSKLLYQSYNGYVLSQFKKLEQDLRATGSIRWKHAMHLIRLLLAGVTALREGYVPVPVGAWREPLLAIKRGETPWDEVNAWRLRLHHDFEEAFATTRLPERPDYARANAFLIAARRSAV